MPENRLSLLGAIADLLVRDLQAFGLLSSVVTKTHTPESLKEYAEPRIQLLALLLLVLEKYGDDRAAVWRLPYCYLRHEWPDSTPIAGTTAEPTAPEALNLCHSIVSNWILSLSGGLDVRLKPAALWITYRDGFSTAVAYLLDLLTHGFVLDADCVARTLVWLTGALQGEGSDAERVERLLEGRLPRTPADWMNVLSPEGGAGGEVERPPIFDPERAQEVLITLISRCLDTISRVRRQSSSLDSWLLGQARVHALTYTTLRVCQVLAPDPSLALRTVLSQLEEIMADGPAILLVRNDLLPFDFSFAALGGLGLIFREKVGAGWEERFFEQRLLAPAALRDLILQGGLKRVPLPPAWQRLSWRMVHPVSGAFKIPRPVAFSRSAIPAPQALLRDDALREVLRSQEILEENLQQQVIQDRFHPRLDWNAQYDRDAVDAAIRGTLDRVNPREILDRYRGSNPDSSPAELVEIEDAIGSLLSLYPWNSVLYQEMAVTRDRQERPREAAKHLLAAILLAPADSLPWRSLSVVMRRIGHDLEAVAASIIGDHLEPAERGPSAPSDEPLE